MSLAPPDLNELALEMQASFEWTPTASHFATLSERSIRGGRLYRLKGDTPRSDIALKVKGGWDRGTPEALYTASVELMREWPEGSGVKLVPILGWNPDPPCVCMPYVEGVDLPRVIADRARVSDESDMSTLMGMCGQALGAFHNRFLVRREDSSSYFEARGDLERVMTWLLLPKRTGLGHVPAAEMSRAYGDFAPQNFRVGTGGELYLLDPPSQIRHSPVHRDLGAFSVALGRVLEEFRAEGTTDGSHRGKEELLLGAFFEGYARTGPIDPRAPAARWFVEIYRGYFALRLARNLWNGGRHARALRYGALWGSSLWRLRAQRRLHGNLSR